MVTLPWHAFSLPSPVRIWSHSCLLLLCSPALGVGCGRLQHPTGFYSPYVETGSVDMRALHASWRFFFAPAFVSSPGYIGCAQAVGVPREKGTG
jgi:hypothetical protein